MSLFADREYLNRDPFDGERDVDIRCRSVTIATTRKPQQCYGTDGKMHDMPVGTRVRRERAIVDGKWGTYYVCIPCMDRWLRDMCGLHPHPRTGPAK
jgi:hypothetical protein